MLTKEMMDILSASKVAGWVVEPETKRLLTLAGLDVPRFIWATQVEEALRFAGEIGFPVVGKVVSPKVVHKSDCNGVVIGIDTDKKLIEAFSRFSGIEGFAGMLVEEMVGGLELIVGAKVDDQFGPVILFGMGGTGVEIYRDVVLRMAPLTGRDIESMFKCLKAHSILEGYRGSEPVNRKKLADLLMTFSNLAMDLEKFIQSIDLNPVICSSERCVVADARIMLSG
jgi:acetate---CoA ligase (ADP-forming) subunit beta